MTCSTGAGWRDAIRSRSACAAPRSTSRRQRLLLRRLATPIAVVVLAGCRADSAGGPAGAGIPLQERLELATKFGELSDKFERAGAFTASYVLDLARDAILFGGNASSFTVLSSGAATLRSAAGEPALETTSGSYRGFGLHIAFSDGAPGDVYDSIIGWKGAEEPTEFVFAAGHGAPAGTIGDGIVEAGIFVSPNASWTATSGSASLVNRGAGADCDIPAAVLAELHFAVRCTVATFDAAFTIDASQPSAYEGNSASGSRSASMSANGLAGLSLLITPPDAR
jgi:hypothetical protein